MLTLRQLDEGYSRELSVLFRQLPVTLQSFQINSFLKKFMVFVWEERVDVSGPAIPKDLTEVGQSSDRRGMGLGGKGENF